MLKILCCVYIVFFSGLALSVNDTLTEKIYWNDETEESEKNKKKEQKRVQNVKWIFYDANEN